MAGSPRKRAARQGLTVRPTEFSQAIADAICERLSKGEFLAAICAEPDMPTASMFWYWRQAHAKVATAYARARELQAAAVAHRAYLAAQETDPTQAQLARLKFDAGRWMAGKLDPRNYGDKLQHTNADGSADAVTRVEYAWAAPAHTGPVIDAEPE